MQPQDVVGSGVGRRERDIVNVGSAFPQVRPVLGRRKSV
jgi:hypothetical protein